MKSDTRIIHKNVSIEDPKYWDSDLWFYLKEVIMQYEALGFDINSGKPVLVKYMKDGPMCSNRGIYRVIFLSATEAYWCQYMYQFAHEFCHHLINGPMDGNYVSSFWFEESVCEMASEYFLMKIAKEWIENDTKYGKLGAFRNSMLKYAEKIRKKEKELEVPLSDWIRSKIEELSTTESGEIEKKERSNYKIIAKEMLPLFEKNPELWSILPLLKRLPQEEYISFEHWLTNIVGPQVPANILSAYNELKAKLIG